MEKNSNLLNFLNTTINTNKLPITIISLSIALTLFAASVIAPLPLMTKAQPPVTNLDPLTIPKWTNQLTGPPPVYVPTDVLDGLGNVIRQDYAINMAEQMQQVLPTVDALGNPTGFGTTKVWGYGGQAMDAVTGAPLGYVLNSPGPSFEATKGLPVRVTWTNNITTPQQFAVDPTMHWANPNNIPMPTAPYTAFPPGYAGAQDPAPLVPHLHGGEVQSTNDGGPDAWFTSNGIHGPGYSTVVPCAPNQAVYDYPNINQATTLWYHDHALGVTRLNVMSGLAGYYLLRDPADATGAVLPTGKYDMPIVIQDRSFLSDGSFNFPSQGITDAHPYWVPEFFGDTIMVNGLVWPNMDVDQGVYRLRLLDGSNARFYTLSFVADPGTLNETILPFTQIASDGGYLTAPASLSEITFAPGERVEVLVDFSGLAPGTKVLMKNTANENYPFGLPIDPNTVGQIMQFTVMGNAGVAAPVLPPVLNPTLPSYPTLANATKTRVMTLIEVLDPLTGAPVELVLDGQKWVAPAYEIAQAGETEEWIVFNPTADSHPIHLHLVQFQVISRQPFNNTGYVAAWEALNGPPPLTAPTQTVPNWASFITGPAVPPPASEMGWKDTVMMHPDEVTTIRVRFAPTDEPVTGPTAPVAGVNAYPFDPSVGPGYVWHCHILDHEDNEMMRPLLVTLGAPPTPSTLNLLIREPADTISINEWDAINSTWMGWTPIPGTTVDRPSAAKLGTDTHLVIRDTTGSLYHGIFDTLTSTFSGWTKLSGSTPSAPSLAATSTGLVLTVRGNNNGIYYRQYNGVWSGWSSLPGSTSDAVGSSVIGDLYHIVVRGTNGRMYHGTMTVSTSTFNGWTVMSGTTPSQPVLSDDETNLYLAVRGSTSGIYWTEYTGTWSSWTRVSGATLQSPGATIYNNKLCLVVTGMSSGFYYSSIDLTTLAWSGWSSITGTSPSPPSYIS